MALKYIDGFEQYPANSATATLLARSNSLVNYTWTANSGGNNVVTTYYRTAQTNASSFSINSSCTFLMTIPTNQTVILGFGVYPATTLGDGYSILNFNNVFTNRGASGPHLDIMANGSIRLYNENTNTNLQQSGPGIIVANVWQYVEIKMSFSATVGTYEVRVNGNTILSGTGVDTLCGLASVSHLNLTHYGYIDDFYICDDSGATNNDFLGPISVYTLLPSSNGTVNNFSFVGGASNYASVNTKIDTTTTYVKSGVTNDKDLYQIADLPVNTGIVHGVLVRSYMTKLDNGARTTQLIIKTSGTEANSSNFNATMGSWLNAWAVFEKQADGATAWDIAAVNALEIGHKNT